MLYLLLPLLAIPDWDSVGSALETVAAKLGLKPIYRTHKPGDTYCSYAFKRASDGVTLFVRLGQEDNLQNVESQKRFFESGAGGKNPQASPSNIPLGDFCVVLNERHSIRTVGEGFIVDAKIPSLLHGSGAAKDLRLLEAMARTAMAEAMGSNFRSNGTPLPRTNPSFERPRDQYEVLSNLLEKHRLKAKPNEWGDRYTFTANRHTVEFALGSDTASVDGKEVKLGAFIASRNQVWVLPSGPILAAIGIKTKG